MRSPLRYIRQFFLVRKTPCQRYNDGIKQFEAYHVRMKLPGSRRDFAEACMALSHAISDDIRDRLHAEGTLAPRLAKNEAKHDFIVRKMLEIEVKWGAFRALQPRWADKEEKDKHDTNTPNGTFHGGKVNPLPRPDQI